MLTTRIGSGLGAPDLRPPEPTSRVDPRHRRLTDDVNGVVVDLDDLVATIAVGRDAEEWVFPRSMLPGDIVVDSVLTFDGIDSAASVVAHRLPSPSVEDRLERSLNRRRLRPARSTARIGAEGSA